MNRFLTRSALAALGFLSACGGGEECSDDPGSSCSWAGTGELGLNGDGKDRRQSLLYWPIDMEFAPDGTPYILDWNNHLIRRVTAQDELETLVGDFFVGDGPPDQSDLMAPGAPGTTVSLNHPTDIQFLPDGRMLFAAWHNHKLRIVDGDGLVTVLAGRGAGFAGDGTDAMADVRFNQPKAIEVTADGTIYILDQRNFRVRAIDPDGNVTTVAGSGMAGFAGDGGDALMAQMAFEAGGNPEPSGALALGRDGKLYVADSLNHRIRVVDLAAGTIDTVAGTGVAGHAGDGGAATAAQLNNPRDLELGPDGRLYVADTENHVIRAIDLESGVIEHVAGAGFAGKDLGDAATGLELNRPFGIAFDAERALYVSDTFNSRIVRIAP